MTIYKRVSRAGGGQSLPARHKQGAECNVSIPLCESVSGGVEHSGTPTDTVSRSWTPGFDDCLKKDTEKARRCAAKAGNSLRTFGPDTGF